MRTNLLTLITSLCLLVATGQYKIKDGGELLNLQKLPLEKMYVHHTAPLLFSGEYFYYKVYCINAQTNRLSGISTVGYVALVNSEGQMIFEHKLRLENGTAYGDFFLNTDIPSGNYKLVGYTQWMKNGGLDQIFKDDVAIINPYLVDQSGIQSGDNRGNTNSTGNRTGQAKNITTNSPLAIELDTLRFTNRQKVTLKLRNYQGALGYGNYSISVKKKGSLKVPERQSSEHFSAEYLNVLKKIPQTIGDSIYLPEQRGELVYGKLLEKETGSPVADKEVFVSVPGKDFLLKSTKTNENGVFYTYLREVYNEPIAFFQINEEGAFTFDIQQQTPLSFENLKHGSFTVDEVHANLIESRSVHNQLENAYFGAKPDSVLQQGGIDPYFGGIPEVFQLDDYTRFPTLQETLIEILNTVGYRNSNEGQDYIRVAQKFEKFNEAYNDFPAIVLIDGVFIPDHSQIKDFKADLIETIKVVRDQIALGAKQYQGIVSIETIKGDYYNQYTKTNSISKALRLPQPAKNYFKQSYIGDEFNRIPDYRYLLFWEPNISISDDGREFVFYTSDIDGDFEVVLEGFTSYGKPISLSKVFKVN